jgi:CRP-like cAMP-binding protein
MEVCFIPKEIIANTLNTNPNFSLEVLRHMAHDLKEADDVIVNMSQKTVKQRLAEAFVYLKKNYGEDKDGFLVLTLSRDDYANIVGAATESLIRMISEFKKKGLIKTLGKKIGVLEEQTLQELADGF